MMHAAVSGFRSGWLSAPPWQIAMALVLAIAAHPTTIYGAGTTAKKQPSAAELMREVYSAEAWVYQVDSCLLRTKAVQSRLPHRGSSPPPSAAEFEQLRGGDWQETQHSKHEIAWDRTRVRSAQDFAESHRMVTAWDGQTMTVYEKAPWRDREHFGIYDSSRRDLLVSRLVNLWACGGLVTDDRGTWWRTRNPEKNRISRFQRPEDFKLTGRSLVDGRECHVLESRAGRIRLYIDTTQHRVRRMTHFGTPNDLDQAVRLAAMRKATEVRLATPRDWGAWVETLDPGRRLAAERRYFEELFPSMRIRREVYPTDYAEVVPGGWMPRRFTSISSYPDWDVVEKTGTYTYKVSRVDVEVTTLIVNQPLSDETLSIRFPEGGKVYDWRFDPPVEYDFRKDRTAEQIRALAEEAERKRDEQTAPYRELIARIEKRLGQRAPELPQGTWLGGEPLELGDLRGKVFLLHFWATWCGPCHNDIRTLVSLNKSSTSDPLVIGIHDSKADVDAVKKAIAEEGIRYPVCIDLKSDTGDGVSQRSWYRIRAIPYTILIDKEGRVAGHGALDDMLEKASRME